ncbi:AAA family ATPase [uncultured Thiodictyon sp.]|uniref:AAA family ATPase n=1 Tax=uncultured Thiodictyon sp. TaxID=1846217 RepID=UPI0025CCC79C|nr:AAA family ATPase [uncultured Thiodictyon sp.]
MKVLSLHLINFRGIAELRVDFTEQTTAFVGINGVGKSAVLDALAIALSQLIWRINGSPQKARQIALDDIRHGADFARISMTVHLPGGEVQWAIAKNRKGGQYADPLRKSDLDALNEAARKVVDLWDHVESDNLPLAVYYDVNRTVLEIPMRVREQLRINPYEVYQDALDHGGADFKRFFIWFRNFEDAENERRTEDPEHREPGLQAARTAITAFTGFENLRVRRKPLLRMTVTKGGDEFNVLQLSDGERNMLALVGDLARRLSVLNPSLANPNKGGGVVLIDEIDLHLHPRWQREVVGKLERTFPHCQFIISTHSPQVVGELKATSVMLLKDGALLGHAERALGLSSGEVLEELMEGRARNASVETALDDLRGLIDEDRLDEAHVKLERLRSQVGDIPEVLEAQSAIQSLELAEGNEA